MINRRNWKGFNNAKKRTLAKANIAECSRGKNKVLLVAAADIKEECKFVSKNDDEMDFRVEIDMENYEVSNENSDLLLSPIKSSIKPWLPNKDNTEQVLASTPSTSKYLSNSDVSNTSESMLSLEMDFLRGEKQVLLTKISCLEQQVYT